MTHSFPTRRSSDLLLRSLFLHTEILANWDAVCICDIQQSIELLIGILTAKVALSRYDVLHVLAWVSTKLASLLDERPQALSERSEEHTSELQSLMRISYAVFCLQKTQTQHT